MAKKWGIYTHPVPEHESRDIESLLTAIEWEEVHLTFSEQSIGQAQSLKTMRPYGFIISELLAENVDQQVCTSYASRIVKPSANWKIVSIGNGQKLAQGFAEARINRECGPLL